MEHAFCLSLPWLFGWTSWHLQVGMRHGLGSAFALLIKSCVCIMQWKYLIKEFFQVKSSRTRTAPETLLYPLQNGFHRVSQTSRHRGCGELQTRAPWDFQLASKDFQSKCVNCRFPVLICMNLQPRPSSWLLMQHDSQIGLLKLPSWWSVVSLLWESSINTHLISIARNLVWVVRWGA